MIDGYETKYVFHNVASGNLYIILKYNVLDSINKLYLDLVAIQTQVTLTNFNINLALLMAQSTSIAHLLG